MKDGKAKAQKRRNDAKTKALNTREREAQRQTAKEIGAPPPVKNRRQLPNVGGRKDSNTKT